MYCRGNMLDPVLIIFYANPLLPVLRLFFFYLPSSSILTFPLLHNNNNNDKVDGVFTPSVWFQLYEIVYHIPLIIPCFIKSAQALLCFLMPSLIPLIGWVFWSSVHTPMSSLFVPPNYLKLLKLIHHYIYCLSHLQRIAISFTNILALRA